ncbi:sensor histidine kinase [Paramagnetospirillum magneticum]|uniref:sensor histidine kinase n=1 Tax=Paramagnetospirillum magneticum TaxID=84159 RepID=UPI0002ED0484|nr:PhnD/SsuA/transferrin family substrate-binding protein [Paramagnetospirillum magneticum]
MVFRLFLICCLLTCSGAFAAEVRIGVLAFQGAERALRTWEPTAAHLNRSVGGSRFVLVPLDLDAMSRAVAGREVDFVITNPGNYIALESGFGATRLVTVESERSGSPIAAIGSTVVARGDRPDLDTLAGLKGRRLAVVSTEAFGGYQVLWRELAALGLDPSDDLREIRQTGFPMERVAQLVRDGLVDAGVLRACLLEEMIAEGALAPGELRVVGRRDEPKLPCAVSSRLYPDWPFAKLAETSHDLAKQVAAALLSMPAVDGQAWTAPQDYTQVHALMQDLEIGPYAHLRQHLNLAELARRHWQWLVIAAMAVLWWVVHVARVEVLVRRRTAELEREIAERERAENDAARHRAERDQFSRLGILGEMASNIAHELNQPLAAIMNYARGMSRMLDGGQADPAMLADGAQAVATQAERAAAIIQRIRGFVRRRKPRRERLDINEVVAETLALFESLAGRRGIAVHVHLAEGLPGVSVDRGEIQQVLLNILQNAVDATAGQGAEAGDGITVRTSPGEGGVKVAVRDCGAGLSQEAEARLFEPFFTTKPEGLGLGLSICRTIIEAHGGRLWASANPRRGLTLRFVIPPAEAPA